jgi:photosystem II stability/assembly factor-like uncharacterized protein
VELRGTAPPAIYWEPSIGPYTARITSLGLAGHTLLAGSLGGGIFRSTSNGDVWQASSTGLDSVGSLTINSLLVTQRTTISASTGAGSGATPQRAFAATDFGVYASDNSGTSWRLLGAANGLPNDEIQLLLAGRGDTVFVTTGETIFVTENGGERWRMLTPPRGFNTANLASITALHWTGTDLVLGAASDADEYTIWRCTLQAASDQASATQLFTPTRDDSYTSDFYVTCFAEHNGKLYAGTYNGFVFKYDTGDNAGGGSTNGGGRWTTLADKVDFGTGASANNAGRRIQSLTSNGAGTTTILYAGTENGVFRSSDDGATWQPNTTTRGLTEPNITTLLANGVETYAGTNAGIFRTRTRGSSWFGSSAGLSAAVTTALKEHRGVMLAGTAGSGAFRSTDNGSSWQPTNAGLRGRFIGNFSSVNSAVYAAARHLSFAGQRHIMDTALRRHAAPESAGRRAGRRAGSALLPQHQHTVHQRADVVRRRQRQFRRPRQRQPWRSKRSPALSGRWRALDASTIPSR